MFPAPKKLRQKNRAGSGSCVISCRRIFSYQILTRHSSVQPRSPKNPKKIPASPNPNGLPSLTHLFIHLPRGSCYLRIPTGRSNPIARYLLSVLVIARRVEYTARQSAYQFYTYRTPLVIAMEHSDRSNLFASSTCFWITSLRS